MCASGLRSGSGKPDSFESRRQISELQDSGAGRNRKRNASGGGLGTSDSKRLGGNGCCFDSQYRRRRDMEPASGGGGRCRQKG